MADSLRFFREAVRSGHQVGALFASSRVLADAVVRPLASRPAAPVRVLEIGPGTGAITTAILDLLVDGDRLDLCEANAAFASDLAARYRDVPGPRVRVYHSTVGDFKADGRYDYVVSSLPLMNMTTNDVEKAFELMLGALVPAGTLSFWHHTGWSLWRWITPYDSERERRAAVADLVDCYVEVHGIGERLVLANLPPARVHWLVR